MGTQALCGNATTEQNNVLIHLISSGDTATRVFSKPLKQGEFPL